MPDEVRRSPNVISQGHKDREVQKRVQEYCPDGRLDTGGGVKKKAIEVGWSRCGMS